MAGMLKMLAAFLGVLLKELLPTILDEYRKPRAVKVIGDTPELDAAIDASIKEEVGFRELIHQAQSEVDKAEYDALLMNYPKVDGPAEEGDTR